MSGKIDNEHLEDNEKERKPDDTRKHRLTSLIFGSAGYGSNSVISVDCGDYVLPDPDDVPRPEPHVQIPDISMLLEALDHDDDLKELFRLSRLDEDLAFALRHAIIFYLQRISHYGATATGLMVECLARFIHEHPSHKGSIERWEDRLARLAEECKG